MKKSESKSRTSNNPGVSGLLVVLSAPSGCGKTTIVERLLKRHSEWVRSISVTTRAPRLGEKNGEDYFFVTASEFQKMEESGELLESAKVFDHFYGTPKQFVTDRLNAGKKILLAIDVQGAKKVKQVLVGQAPMATFFILPPSVKILRERLEGRNTESPAEIQRRIEIAQDEIKEAGSYDHAVMNRNLDKTVQQIESAIESFQPQRS